MLEVLRRYTGVKTPASDLPLSCFTFREVKLSWLDFTGIVSVENWSNTAENQLWHALKDMLYSLLFRPLRFLASKWLFWVPYNFSPKFSGGVFSFCVFFFLNCVQVELARKWWKKNMFHVASWHCIVYFSLHLLGILRYCNILIRNTARRELKW